jgi:hypothetical protein
MLARALSAWGRLLGWGRGTPPEAERRDSVRYPSTIETVCRPAERPDALPLPARVQDISAGGINLVVGRRFEPGDLLSVDIPSGEEGTSTVLACVVWADRARGGGWSLGCVLTTTLADDELIRLGARPPRPSAPDPRAAVRVPCQARAQYQRVRLPDSPPETAEVVNLSAGGIALLVDEPVDLGEVLSLGLHAGDGEVVGNVLASVVRVASQNGRRLVGCNFIGELGAEQMKALAGLSPDPAG